MLYTLLAICKILPILQLGSGMQMQEKPQLCGADAAYVFLRSLCIDVDYPELVTQLQASQSGISFSRIGDVLSKYGVCGTVVSISPKNYKLLSTPCIALLEPSTSGALHHYVVIIELSNGRITYFDPVKNGVSECTHDIFGNLSTGYFYLETKMNLLSLEFFAFIFALVFLSLIILRKFISSKFSILRRCKIYILLPCIANILMGGCSQGDRKSTSTSSLITFENTKIAAGVLSHSKGAITYGFTFKNTSNEKIKVDMVNYSCACLKGSVKPSNYVEPGQSGAIDVIIDPNKLSNAGEIEGVARLTVNNGLENHVLRIYAFNEGIGELVDTADANFTIRKSQLIRNKINPLRLYCYTSSSNSRIKIHGHRLAFPSSALDASDNLSKLVKFDTANHEVKPMNVTLPSSAFLNEIVIPVEIAKDIQANMSGAIEIDYSIDTIMRTKVVNFFVLAR